MVQKLLVKHGAPTLAGIKTGNIFTVKDSQGRIDSEIRKLNRILLKKGLSLIPVRRTENATLVYLFRPDRLKKDLQRPEAREILMEKGYSCGDANICIVNLVQHLKLDASFPHEIGLFLGYPPSDVKGFMENPSEGVKCSGCWKAYGNECEAKRTFARYQSCTRAYEKAMQCGMNLESLIV